MGPTVLVVSLTLAFGALAARAEPWRPPAGLAQEPIWPGNPPGAPPVAEPESLAKAWVTNVSTPTMTVVPPKSESTGVAVIVFPGGGYMGLAMDLEGTEVCDWLTSKGVTCVLLKYRVPRSGQYWDQRLHRHVEPEVPAALQDAQRTIRLVRSRARQLGIDPHKIGVLGFSAGGHLAAESSTAFERPAYAPADDVDKESARPDFAVPIYPGHLWASDRDPNRWKLNPRMRVGPRTPPTFLLQAEDDHVDGVEQSLVYYRALKEAKVPVEMHLYAEGGHAFGLRPTKLPISRWPELVETWLRTIGMISDVSAPGTALDAAVAMAGLHPSDPLEVKIEKTLEGFAIDSLRVFSTAGSRVRGEPSAAKEISRADEERHDGR